MKNTIAILGKSIAVALMTVEFLMLIALWAYAAESGVEFSAPTDYDLNVICTIKTENSFENPLEITESPCNASEATETAETAVSPITCPNPYESLITGLTEGEIDLLYKITWAEANNQNIDPGQRAVIEVIFNRMLSGEWGNGKPGQPASLESVLSEKGQFATWRSRNKVKYNADQPAALQLVLEEAPVLPSTDYVYFATKKHSWMHNAVKIGDHYFGTK